MKQYIFLISIMVSLVTWWLGHPRRKKQRNKIAAPLRNVFNSLIAGLITYFILMFIAMIWLLITAH